MCAKEVILFSKLRRRRLKRMLGNESDFELKMDVLCYWLHSSCVGREWSSKENLELRDRASRIQYVQQPWADLVDREGEVCMYVPPRSRCTDEEREYGVWYRAEDGFVQLFRGMFYYCCCCRVLESGASALQSIYPSGAYYLCGA